MPEWLFDVIRVSEPDRRPDFARKSAVNWIQALSFEVDRVHGTASADQWMSCHGQYAGVERRSRPLLAAVFEPLLASMTYSASLLSLASEQQVESWKAPGAIVEWYYAVYNA